ncbi:hypothetical protein BGW80DRAFT_1459496 [Lactifluus volemus]|nr:hypothetical protein BGW80DRAFT_1459496 [Lactifluus volemus]
MANGLPPQGPQKVPVVAILLDSALPLFLAWDRVHSLCRGLLVDPLSTVKPLVGFLTYGPPGSVGSPVFFKHPFAEDAHELLGNPSILGIGDTTTECTSGMSVLEGYAAAIEMLDAFQSGNKERKETFSYHLWHFAAETPDGNKCPNWNDSPTLDSLTWETLPFELEKRNIKYLMIVVQHSPIFKLFAANSVAGVVPWFPTCPFCTIPQIDLSPGLEVTKSIMVCAHAAHPQVFNHAPGTHELDMTAQRVHLNGIRPRSHLPMNVEIPQAPIICAGMTVDAPLNATTVGQRSDGQWSGTLLLKCTTTPLQARVSTTHPIGKLLASTWPKVLSLELTGLVVSIDDFQEWMKVNKPAVMRFRPTTRNDPNFGHLVELLRVRSCYAVASWELSGKGRPTRNLLMRPVGQSLLGAVFPVSGIPGFPKRY